MEQNKADYLDLEFKRYLQLLRPYLGQLIDQDVIQICDAWIKRLSECKEQEKPLRNKYIFTLCYQLAKGILDHPFLSCPPVELDPIENQINTSDSSIECEYLPTNPEQNETQTKIIFDGKKISVSECEYISQDEEPVINNSEGKQYKMLPKSSDHGCNDVRQQTLFCYTYQDMQKNACKIPDIQYEFRTSNLVKKLREIKIQNILLQKELEALKEEAKTKHDESGDDSDMIKIDTVTSMLLKSHGSDVTLKSLKFKLQEVQESRKALIQSVNKLQDKLDNFNELKKNEIEEIRAQHELDLIKLRSAIREESKEYYDKKIDDLKHSYEEMVKKIQDKANTEIVESNSRKDDMISEKNKLLEIKDAEIIRLKSQLEDQRSSLHSLLNKIIEKPNATDEVSYDGLKLKAQQLEKRLNKSEKSKIKCTKMYEAKLAQLQREKHLAECSLQLQLVRQRAQVVSELTDESQAELNASLDKLETKYKDIVANVQATALQRRLQDQIALDSIFQAACGIRAQSRSQFQPAAANNPNQSYDSEISSLIRGNKVGNVTVGNKSFGEDLPGYCLNGERMGELFERVYIPQRDGAAK